MLEADMGCLYCPDGAESCSWCKPVAKGVPDGRFTHTTATQQQSVLRGLHPMGHKMPEPGSRACNETCGSCGHRETATTGDGKPSFSKCAFTRHSAGKATDTRRRWPACARWESKETVDADKQAEATVARMP